MAYAKPSIFVGRTYSESHDANPKPIIKRRRLRINTGGVKAICQCQASARQAYWMARHSKAENAADYNHLPLDALIAGAITRVDRILRIFHVCSHAGRDARHSAEPGLEGAYALRQRLSAGNALHAALRLSKAAGPRDAGCYARPELPAGEVKNSPVDMLGSSIRL